MLYSKKGQIGSLILVIITIFIIGIIFFFSSHVVEKLYSGFDNYFEQSGDYNQSEAHQALQDIQGLEQSHLWDYAFLAIFIGFIIQMVIFSYATRISIVFYWLYGIIGIVGLIIAVIVSSIWQGMVNMPEFATTITRFPITNTILGTYYPVMITAAILLIIIAVFGKPPQQTVFGGE